jgi:hypothetical protein
MDIHMAELFWPELSLVKVETGIGKLKRYKSPGTDQILAKVIKAGGTQTFIQYGIRRNCHISGRNLLLYQFIKRVMRLVWVPS